MHSANNLDNPYYFRCYHLHFHPDVELRGFNNQADCVFCPIQHESGIKVLLRLCSYFVSTMLMLRKRTI